MSTQMSSSNPDEPDFGDELFHSAELAPLADPPPRRPWRRRVFVVVLLLAVTAGAWFGVQYFEPDLVQSWADSLRAAMRPAEAEAAKGPKLIVSKSAAEADTELAKLPAGDAAKGEKLFTLSGCIGCHSQEKDKKLVGPSFYGLFTRAAERKPGYAAKAYLYESIVNPNEHVVEGFQPNLMQQTYAATLSQQDMADLLAWIEKTHAEK